MAVVDDAETLANALGRAAESARLVLRHVVAHGHLGEPEDTRPETDVWDTTTNPPTIISLGKRDAQGNYRSPGRGAPAPDLTALAADVAAAQSALSALGNAPAPTAEVPWNAAPVDTTTHDAPPTAPGA